MEVRVPDTSAGFPGPSFRLWRLTQLVVVLKPSYHLFTHIFTEHLLCFRHSDNQEGQSLLEFVF